MILIFIKIKTNITKFKIKEPIKIFNKNKHL